MQLEPGATASTFERRAYSSELALCQRYYEVLPSDSACGTLNADNGTMNVSFVWQFKATKRVAPTMTYGAGTLQFANVNAANFYGSAAGQGWYFVNGATASAEL